ncbi:MAG: phenylalanine--tRNA ligase subunit beta [Thermoplasmatales archaeon]
MVLVRFDLAKMESFSSLTKEDIIATPWLLGGEARAEEDKVVMEFNPDRPDLYSIQGATRAIRQYLGKEAFTRLRVEDSGLEILLDAPRDRPFFAACIVKGIVVRGLLEYIIDYQEKLHLTMGRNRKKSAIGLHDLKKVKFPLKYTHVDRNIDFYPLGSSESTKISSFMEINEKAREFGHLVSGRLPAILDSEGEIISLPPILNSSITTVDENTTDIFIDVTGIDRNTVLKTLILMATALSYPAGGLSTVVVNGEKVPELREETFEIPTAGIKRIVGYEVGEDLIREALEKMGYLVDERVTVPPYRVDILGEVDIVEDVLKGIGFQNVKGRRNGFQRYGEENKLRKMEERLRRLLIGYDLSETVSSVLVNTTFNRMYEIGEPVKRIINPISQEQDSIRKMITPSLFQTFLNNFRNPYPQRIFEIGTIYDEDGESDVLGIGIADKDASFSEIKGLVIGILEDLGVEDYSIERGDKGFYIPGRVGRIIAYGRTIGFFGEMHPRILRQLGIKMPVATAELKLELIGK